MKCCCTNPLTQTEKDYLIKEAEKIRPLSQSEKEALIKNAESDRARGVCHYHQVDHSDMFKKLILLFGIIAALGLLYYLFMYRAQPHVPQTTPMQQQELAPQVAPSKESQQAVAKSVDPIIQNASKIMVDEVTKEPASAATTEKPA